MSNPNVMSLGDLAKRGGVRSNEVVRVVGPSGVLGRVKYGDAGRMWRERSNLSHFVSLDGSFHRRRYLPEETLVEVSIDPSAA